MEMTLKWKKSKSGCEKVTNIKKGKTTTKKLNFSIDQ